MCRYQSHKHLTHRLFVQLCMVARMHDCTKVMRTLSTLRSMQRMIVRLERLAQLAHGLLGHFTDARVIHLIQAEQLVMI